MGRGMAGKTQFGVLPTVSVCPVSELSGGKSARSGGRGSAALGWYAGAVSARNRGLGLGCD